MVRGSELFACTVFNMSIYFCLALCFLQSRSHKLFKTPNFLKIRFENQFLHWFSEKNIFWEFLKNWKILTFFAKNRKCWKLSKKLIFQIFGKMYNIFDFSQKSSKCSVFQKNSKNIFSENQCKNWISKRIFKKLGVLKSLWLLLCKKHNARQK